MVSPKRFTIKPATLPDGKYGPGIADKEIGAAVGYVLTIWPHVEEQMIGLFQFLAGVENPEDARLIFRTMKAQRQRIELMRNMLSLSPSNANLPDTADNIIKEYDSINDTRNDYAHGLWWHNTATGKTYLEPKLANSGMIFIQGREVTGAEVKILFDRMMALIKQLKEPDLYKR